MNRIGTVLITLALIMLNNQLKAQSSKDSIDVSINPYASFRGNMALYKKEMDLQDNASRVGLKASFKKGKISFLAATELHLNLFRSEYSFNLDANPSDGFLDVKTTSNVQTISNRLGYIGFDFEKYGRITFGKQWSVYYDITSYTDQFKIFGANASATFIGGTDGGDNGTGRANSAIIYRNQFGPFLLGAQAQIRGSNNNKFIDGFGFSGQLEVTKQILAGVTFNRALLNDNLISQDRIIGLNGEPSYYAAGIKYQGDRFLISAIGVVEKNGDFAQGSYYNINNDLISPTVVFDSKGFEFYVNYKLNKFSIHAGYNLYTPKTNSIPIENNQYPLSKKFKTNDVIAGFTYQPIKYIQIYAEQRLSYGRSADDVKKFDVFALGMTLDISKTFKTKTFINK